MLKVQAPSTKFIPEVSSVEQNKAAPQVVSPTSPLKHNQAARKRREHKAKQSSNKSTYNRKPQQRTCLELNQRIDILAEFLKGEER